MTLVSRKYLGALMAALFSGVLLSLPLSLGLSSEWLNWLVPVALVPLFVAIERLPVQTTGGVRTYHKAARVSLWGRGTQAFTLFWLAGAAFCALGFSWGPVALLRDTNLTHPSVYALFFAYCLLSGLYFPLVFSPFILSAARGARKQMHQIPIWALAFVVTGIEIWFPRNWSWTFGSLADFSVSINQWASMFGSSALTPVVVGGSAYLARGIVGAGSSMMRALAVVMALCAVWLFLFGLGEWRLSVMENRVEGIRKTQVAVILPGGHTGKTKRERTPESDAARLDALIQLTQKTLAENGPKGKPDLVIWPKDEVPENFTISNEQQEKVRILARESGVPVLVPADEYEGTQVASDVSAYKAGYKAAFLIRADGSKSESYRQRFLSPFDEDLPFEDSLPFVTNLMKEHVGISKRWHNGTTSPALPFSADFRVGVLLSFDAMHPEIAQKEAGRTDDADTGEAGVLVHLSSFSAVVGTDAPGILQGLARWRAIEAGRSMVSVGAAGYVWAFDPLGRTIVRESTREAKGLMIQLPAFDPDTAFDTFYSQFRNTIYALFVTISAGAILFTFFRRSH